MKINDVKKYFKSQMEGAVRTNQLLTFILKHSDGHKTVETVSIWEVGSLTHEFDYIKENQKGHSLPVLSRKTVR